MRMLCGTYAEPMRNMQNALVFPPMGVSVAAAGVPVAAVEALGAAVAAPVAAVRAPVAAVGAPAAAGLRAPTAATSCQCLRIRPTCSN